MRSDSVELHTHATRSPSPATQQETWRDCRGTAAYLVTVVPSAHADEASNTIPPSPTLVMPSVDIGEYLTNRDGPSPSRATVATNAAVAVSPVVSLRKGPIMQCPLWQSRVQCSRGRTARKAERAQRLTAARSESACRR